MSPDVVYGWLKCVGYGLVIIICGWVFSQKAKETKIKKDNASIICLTCKYCTTINHDGYISCEKSFFPGYHPPKKCSAYEAEEIDGIRYESL